MSPAASTRTTTRLPARRPPLPVSARRTARRPKRHLCWRHRLAPEQQSTERLLAITFGPVFFAASNDDGSGSLFFLREGSLVAQRFDPARLALSGEPQQIAAPVGSFLDRALFWVSRNRTIVYAAAAPALDVQLTWMDRQGKVLRTVGPQGPFSAIVRSPDGKRAAANRLDLGSAVEKRELWLWDLERDAQSLFWFKSTVMSPPVWSPDSTRLLLALVDDGPQLYERAVNGIQEGRVVFRGNRGDPLVPTSWSPDGRFILFTRPTPNTGADIWALTPDDGRAAPLYRHRRRNATRSSRRMAGGSPIPSMTAAGTRCT